VCSLVYQRMGGNAMRARSFVSLSAVIVFGAVACAGNRGGIAVTHPESAFARDSITISVLNDHWYDARVYVVYGDAIRYPLGVVANKREAGPFTIPWHVQPLAMEVDFIIEYGRYLSDEILVDPGDLVELRIPPNIAASGFFRIVP